MVTAVTCVQVQNEQCQEMAQTDDQKWIKLTTNGEWDTHTVRRKAVCVIRVCYMIGVCDVCNKICVQHIV